MKSRSWCSNLHEIMIEPTKRESQQKPNGFLQQTKQGSQPAVMHISMQPFLAFWVSQSYIPVVSTVLEASSFHGLTCTAVSLIFGKRLSGASSNHCLTQGSTFFATSHCLCCSSFHRLRSSWSRSHFLHSSWLHLLLSHLWYHCVASGALGAAAAFTSAGDHHGSPAPCQFHQPPQGGTRLSLRAQRFLMCPAFQWRLWAIGLSALAFRFQVFFLQHRQKAALGALILVLGAHDYISISQMLSRVAALA